MTDNLEQQCEDALFELCDARERYPQRCAEELQKSIQITNDINMLKMFQKTPPIDKPFTLEGIECLNFDFIEDKMCFNHMDIKLQNIMNKLDNLRAVMNQIEREKECPMNKLLED